MGNVSVGEEQEPRRSKTRGGPRGRTTWRHSLDALCQRPELAGPAWRGFLAGHDHWDHSPTGLASEPPSHLSGLVGRVVVDQDHLQRPRIVLRQEGRQAGAEHERLVPSRDDDRNRGPRRGVGGDRQPHPGSPERAPEEHYVHPDDQRDCRQPHHRPNARGRLGVGAVVERASASGAWRPAGEPQSADLVSTWTAPTAPRGGVGVALVSGVLQWASDADFRRVTIWVAQVNDAATCPALDHRLAELRASTADAQVKRPAPPATERRQRSSPAFTTRWRRY